MKKINCHWFETRFDDFLAGQLPPSEVEMAQVHLAICTECTEKVHLWKGLIDAMPTMALPPLPPLQERQLLLGNTPVSSTNQARKSPQRLRPFIALAAILVAAAALFLAHQYLRPAPQAPARDVQISTTQQTDTAPAPVHTDAAGRRFIPVTSDSRLWLAQDAHATLLRLTDTEATLEVTQGLALAEISGLPKGFRFVVSTPTDVIEAHGTVFSVAVDAQGTQVMVQEGRVTVRAQQGDWAQPLSAMEAVDTPSRTHRSVKASVIGDVMHAIFADALPQALITRLQPVLHAPKDNADNAKDAPPPAAQTPSQAQNSRCDQRLLEAETHRHNKDYPAASAALRRVLNRCPGTREASVAEFSLADLHLGPLGQPAKALAHYNAFLRQNANSPLSTEAHMGKVRALSALGRSQAVIDAVDHFLPSDPKGQAVPEMLRRKGDALKKLERCQEATDVFAQIIQRYPDSAQAAYARTAMSACAAER